MISLIERKKEIKRFLKTLNKFEKMFDIKATYHHHYDICYYSFFTNTIADKLSGKRLYKYIINNFYDKLFTNNVTFDTCGSGFIEAKFVERKSNIFYEKIDCPLTDNYEDTYILKCLYDYIEKPNLTYSFKNLIADCLNNFVRNFKPDYF